jgi:hypothetical protein
MADAPVRARRVGFPRAALFYVLRPESEQKLASALPAGSTSENRVVVVCGLGGAVSLQTVCVWHVACGEW